MSEYAFDVRLLAVLRVTADNEEEARRMVGELSGENARDHTMEDGDMPEHVPAIRITEFTPITGTLELFEENGKEIQ